MPTGPDKSMIINWYLGNLKIVPFRDSQLANISFLSSSPETAAQVANAHAQAFIDKTTQMTISAFKKGLNWLKNQLKDQKNKLELSYTIMGLDSEIMALRGQLDKLKAKKLEITANYGPRHPKMTDINSGIKQLEKEIYTYKKRLAKVGNKESVNEKEINYDVLKQEVKSDQQTYDFLLKQAKELGLASMLDTSNISIVDKAEVPRIPVKPRTFLNILLALVMSMFMGPFLAFFFEYMDDTVKTPEDIQRKLGLPVLGMIPFYNSKKEKKNTALFWDKSVRKKGKYAKTYYDSDVANPLIPSIQVMLQKLPGQVFFIQSATSGEGKTTVLANSALKLSRNGFKVLMVDADIKHPALHQLFEIENNYGLVNAMKQILSHNIHTGTLNSFVYFPYGIFSILSPPLSYCT
ncbi:MAG: P-loop NTPase [Candidatus Mariimomonas ferrooxydans]